MRTLGILAFLACLVAAIPWNLALTRHEQWFVLFALAPPLLFGLIYVIRESGKHPGGLVS